MKILHLLKSTSYSGAENVVISIMKNCNKKEYEMVYASPDGSIRERVLKEGLTFYPIEKINVRGVKKVIEAVKPDVIHAHDFSMSIYAAFAAKQIPVISHLHNNPLWIKKINPKTLLYLWSTRKYKRILTVSDAIEKEFLFSNMFSKKVEVLGNVVDKEVVLQKAGESYQGLEYDVIFLGRLSSQKCPIRFCEIIEKLKKECPSVRAVMVGSGELEEEVKEYIQQHNLKETIDLAGFQDNPYIFLQHSKLLLLPSAWEGFGLVAVEAMILGKPVICSGVGGLKDIVTSDCGSICTYVEDYAEKIKCLLQNKNICKSMSEAACKRAEYFCNYKSYMEKLYRIYLETLH